MIERAIWEKEHKSRMGKGQGWKKERKLMGEKIKHIDGEDVVKICEAKRLTMQKKRKINMTSQWRISD